VVWNMIGFVFAFGVDVIELLRELIKQVHPGDQLLEIVASETGLWHQPAHITRHTFYHQHNRLFAINLLMRKVEWWYGRARENSSTLKPAHEYDCFFQS